MTTIITSRTWDVETTSVRANYNSTFGYKHFLQRHFANVHSTQSGQSDSAELTDKDEEDEQTTLKGVKDIQWMDINSVTGMSYTTQASVQLVAAKTLRCPWRHCGHFR